MKTPTSQHFSITTVVPTYYRIPFLSVVSCKMNIAHSNSINTVKSNVMNTGPYIWLDHPTLFYDEFPTVVEWWLFLHTAMLWWRHQMEPFPRNWPFVRGIHRSLANSPNKGQWRGALMFSLICAWINGSVNNGEGGDLRRHRAHYDVIVMSWQ